MAFFTADGQIDLFSTKPTDALVEFFGMMETYPGLASPDEDVVLIAFNQIRDDFERNRDIIDSFRGCDDLATIDKVRVSRAQDALEGLLRELASIVNEVLKNLQ